MSRLNHHHRHDPINFHLFSPLIFEDLAIQSEFIIQVIIQETTFSLILLFSIFF